MLRHDVRWGVGVACVWCVTGMRLLPAVCGDDDGGVLVGEERASSLVQQAGRAGHLLSQRAQVWALGWREARG